MNTSRLTTKTPNHLSGQNQLSNGGRLFLEHQINHVVAHLVDLSRLREVWSIKCLLAWPTPRRLQNRSQGSSAEPFPRRPIRDFRYASACMRQFHASERRMEIHLLIFAEVRGIVQQVASIIIVLAFASPDRHFHGFHAPNRSESPLHFCNFVVQVFYKTLIHLFWRYYEKNLVILGNSFVSSWVTRLEKYVTAKGQ